MNTCKPRKLIIGVTVGILGISLMPITLDLSYTVQVINNFMHIPVFAWMSIILLQVFRNFRLPDWLWFLCSLATALLIGIVLELLQAFIPGRWPSKGDIHLNMVGVFIGYFTFLLAELFRSGLIRRILCK